MKRKLIQIALWVPAVVALLHAAYIRYGQKAFEIYALMFHR